MSLVTPYTITAGDTPSSAELNTHTDATLQLQGGAPAAGALDFAQLIQIVAQSVNNATWTSLTFTSEGIDSASGHSTTTNTSRYTAVTAGWFEFSGVVAFVFNATGARGGRFAKNGTAIGQPIILDAVGVTYATCVPVPTRKIQLAVGDYVELQGFQSSGGALNTAYTAGNEGSVLEVRWCHS